MVQPRISVIVAGICLSRFLISGAHVHHGSAINPRSLPRYCTEMLDQQNHWVEAFSNARAEVRLENPIKDAHYDGRMQQILREYFEPVWGSELFLINNKTIVYAEIFKANSEGVLHNLWKYDQSKPSIIKGDTIRLQRQCTDANELSKTANSLFGRSVSNVITFIRDPVAHFISGMVEANFRRLDQGSHPKPTPMLHALYEEHKVNVTIVKNILDAIFLMDYEIINMYLKDRKHYSIQSHALLKWKPDFIGRLESMEEDWESMNAYIGTSILYDAALDTHEASLDPMHFKASLMELFQSDDQYLRAVCRLVMVDYVCMSGVYRPPPECADMMNVASRRLQPRFSTGQKDIRGRSRQLDNQYNLPGFDD